MDEDTQISDFLADSPGWQVATLMADPQRLLRGRDLRLKKVRQLLALARAA